MSTAGCDVKKCVKSNVVCIKCIFLFIIYICVCVCASVGFFTDFF